jgi:Fic family protein
VVSDAQTAINRLNSVSGPTLVPLARLLLRTESIGSSKVEGLQLNARDLARAEARLETGRKASQTAAEIVANIDAMELAIHHASAAAVVTVDEIISIHKSLMASAPNSGIAGIIRTEQNWIGGNNYNPCGADFVPPPPEHVRPLLDDLCQVIDDTDLPPIVQAGLVHAQFEAIHPFGDGNGRTGRALIHVVLRRRGLTPHYVPPISVVLASRKDEYIAGLKAFTQSDVPAWLTMFAVAATQSAILADSYLIKVEELQKSWRAKLRAGPNPRQDSVAWKLIDILPAHPMITVPVAVTATGRSKSVVGEAFSQLEKCGVVIRSSPGDRNRMWEATQLFDLITNLEAALPAG